MGKAKNNIKHHMWIKLKCISIIHFFKQKSLTVKEVKERARKRERRRTKGPTEEEKSKKKRPKEPTIFTWRMVSQGKHTCRTQWNTKLTIHVASQGTMHKVFSVPRLSLHHSKNKTNKETKTAPQEHNFFVHKPAEWKVYKSFKLMQACFEDHATLFNQALFTCQCIQRRQ